MASVSCSRWEETTPALWRALALLPLCMATVTSTFAQTLAAAAGYNFSETGVVSAGDRVVHKVRIEDGARMTDADYFAFTDWISSAHPDRATLVLAYGDRLHMDDLGALGLAIRTAPTLRDSLIRAERYFRLIQSVMIAMNLMQMQSALLLLTGATGMGAPEAEAMALHALNLHAHGYDLGLVFFGFNSFLTGYLIWISGLFPRVIGGGIVRAGLGYLSGSTLRFFAPALFDAFAPAYGITILAEGAFCVVLLLGWTGTRPLRTA